MFIGTMKDTLAQVFEYDILFFDSVAQCVC